MALWEIGCTHGLVNRKTHTKMRTKTLLIAVAALAAAVTSSHAQTVYSQNVVGYVNIGLNPGGYELASPALDADGTGTNGTISTVIGTNVVKGTTVLVFNGSGYDSLEFAPITKGGANVWEENGVATPSYPLNVGEGFWISDPTDTNLTEVGTVMSGTVTNAYFPPAATYGLLASPIPYGGDITTNLNYVANKGDTILTYNGTGYTSFQYAPITKGGANVWEVNGVAQDPQISPGQGFWLLPAAANTWVETYTNN